MITNRLVPPSSPHNTPLQLKHHSAWGGGGEVTPVGVLSEAEGDIHILAS